MLERVLLVIASDDADTPFMSLDLDKSQETSRSSSMFVFLPSPCRTRSVGR